MIFIVSCVGAILMDCLALALFLRGYGQVAFAALLPAIIMQIISIREFRAELVKRIAVENKLEEPELPQPCGTCGLNPILSLNSKTMLIRLTCPRPDCRNGLEMRFLGHETKSTLIHVWNYCQRRNRDERERRDNAAYQESAR